jgi:deferrochelatase/peroxidase EfeB
MIHFDAKHQKSEAKTKVNKAKIKWKNRSEIKIKRKKWKKSEKSEKNEKIDLNFVSLCFPSKITKSKFKAKKSEKKWKNAKNSKKSEKCEKNKKKTWILLHIVSLRSENYSSEAKRKILNENKRKEVKKEKWNFIVK